MRALILAIVLAAGATLSGCASIDQSLFGGGAGAGEPSTVPAPETSDDGSSEATEGQAAAAPDQGAAGGPSSSQQTAAAPTGEPAAAAEAGAAPSEDSSVGMAGTLPSTAPSEAAATPGAPARATVGPINPVAVSVGVAAVAIAPGPDTGTSVNHTIAGIRASLQDGDSRLVGAGQQFESLRRSSAQQLSTYYQTQAQISAHLQIGTTRGNPELVSQWNAAQAALDQLTANINALNTLSSQLNAEASRTRTLAAQIQSTYEVPGANDEDHRQLSVLEDEANQMLVVFERLVRDTTADIRRQTATLSNERPRLAQLQGAIKSGELYANGSMPQQTRAAADVPAVTTSSGAGGTAVAAIRFARANPDYQKALYDALTQALQGQPSASFSVVGVSPARNSAAAAQAAQNTARRHAQDVMHMMTEMGVPPARMALSTTTDPSVNAIEVRVFLR